MESRRTRLLLELDGDAEPVSGHIGPVDGPLRSFTGYASLIAAIQTIRGEPRPDEALATAQADALEGP